MHSHAEIEDRFGVLPNFFRLAPESPEITVSLWGFARFAYLDNPLLSLFKERLFVYLSRFCDVRYCIVRHVGFLLGLGRPSGDRQCPVQTIDEIVRLIRRPFPRGAHVEPYVAQCVGGDLPLVDLPGPDSAMEEAIFALATHAFLQTPDAPRCLVALEQTLGAPRFQHLMVLLAFVRTAHYWTKVHTELTLEEDVTSLLATHETLAECLLNDPEAGTCEISHRVMDELTSLREGTAQHDDLLAAHQALRESDERLRRSNAELAQRVGELERLHTEVRESRRAALNVLEDALQAKEALRESERRQRLALEAGRMGAWEWNIQTNEVIWSAELEAIHGLAPGSFEGTFDADARDIHPEDREFVTGSIARSVEQRRDHRVEYRLLLPNGETTWVEARGRLICDGTGTPVRLVGICQDITERKRAEEVQARLAAIVASSDDAIISKSVHGIITSWNRAAERIFGYAAPEAVGQSILLIVPDDRRAEEQDVLARLRRGETIDHFETERQTKDGRRVSVSLTVSPVKDTQGRIVGASMVARDITERKRAEEERQRLLARTQEQARLTANLNRVGAAVASGLDKDAIVQTVTDLATELTDAEFGAFFYNVIDPQSGEAYLLYTLSGAPKEAFANFPKPRATALFGPTFRGEGIVRLDDVTNDPRYGTNAPYYGKPSGHLPVHSYLAAPVKAPSGEVLGGLFFGHSNVGVFTDQHERLLEGIASWASVALENARLYGELGRAVRARDEFLAVASHELRNPINALQLQLVGLLRAAQEEEDSMAREWVCDRITQATDDVRRLNHLVENLLDVSRLTAGRFDLEPEEVDFSIVIDAVVNRFREQMKDGQVTVHVAHVIGRWDRLRLDQIVTNLLSNALKYGGGKPIEISLDADAETAYFSVTDHGIGIEAEKHARLFEQFERAVSLRQYGGFGLGLWITRQVVGAMGGRISVDSQPGLGSTFSVALPRSASPDTQSADHVSARAGRSAQAGA